MKKRIILVCRLTGSAVALWVSWVFAIGGRSMGPGLDFFRNIHPVLYFSLVALPLLLVIPIWGARRGGYMMSIAVPVFVLAAHCACTMEERKFVEDHKAEGIGPTPRRFDPQCWLAYDPFTGKLSGAD